MSMVVRTNTMALNANNALNKNNSTVAGNLEKLSTGFKINRAADDASGLAISEKMKAQIKALDTASKNAEDGASLIKTAEGYMGEVHDMLNRIVELAEKSANGTYETVDGGTAEKGANAETYSTGAASNTGVDRQALQDEVNQLCAEIDRIAETANFNELKLMNGDMDGEKRTTIATVGNDAVNASTGVITKAAVTFAEATAEGAKASGSALTLQIGETSTASDKLSVNIKSFKTEALFTSVAKFEKTGVTSAPGTVDVGTGKTSLVQSNAKTGSKGVSENDKGVTLNISNQKSASVVAEAVRATINDVSSQRASLGALENRLDYTINNLTTASENITDANSRIRDTDMAKTMMQYTQGNTLTQAAQAMLAQANQAPSSVLQLLQ
ncbi:MAG: flagellin [Ruminococcus sp.]|nr:flagellin [Ruminococcus sp.]